MDNVSRTPEHEALLDRVGALEGLVGDILYASCSIWSQTAYRPSLPGDETEGQGLTTTGRRLLHLSEKLHAEFYRLFDGEKSPAMRDPAEAVAAEWADAALLHRIRRRFAGCLGGTGVRLALWRQSHAAGHGGEWFDPWRADKLGRFDPGPVALMPLNRRGLLA